MVSEQGFWQFSLAYYGRHKKPLLQCQDKYGLNVNLLLWCKYLDSLDIVLKNNHFSTIISSIHHSEQELIQLRQLRKPLKGRAPEAYAHILEAELLLEQQQQHIIVDQFAHLSGYTHGVGNLPIYLQVQHVTLADKLIEAL